MKEMIRKSMVDATLRSVCLLLSLLFLTAAVNAQSTEFTYQGRLLSGTLPANGNYDFSFSLFDAVTGGTQLGLSLIHI